MRTSLSPSFTTNQRSVTYIGSLCFVIQACTTASRAIIVCEIESNWSFIYMMTLSRGWVVYYMFSTPENSRGRSFHVDNHEQPQAL